MNFIRTFIGSFHSARMYHELRKNQSGHGFLYSLLLVMVTILLTCVLYAPMAVNGHTLLFVGENGRPAVLDSILKQVAAQTPEMTFENQVLNQKTPGAHVIHLKLDYGTSKEEVDAITIDTSGKTTTANMRTPILVTANEVIVRSQRDTKIKTFRELTDKDSAKGGPLVIDAEMASAVAADLSELVKDNIMMFYLIVGGIFALFMLAALYVLRMVMMLCLALVGMALASMFNTKASFDELMRLAAVSFTPVAILSATIPMIGDKAPNSMTLLVLGSIMMGAVLYATRNQTPAA